MWIITINGQSIESDDFLVEDLESIEKATKVPWSISNPYKDIATAKAFIAVALLRQGVPEREIAAQIKALTLRTIKDVFEFKPDDGADSESGADPTRPDSASPPSTSRKSSRSPRPLAGGSRPIPDESDSATS